MSQIIEVEINPGTAGAICYMVGDSIGINIAGYLYPDKPKVSAIEIRVFEETRNTIIEILVGEETYCIYENVPYVVYYKTSFHK